MAFGKVFAIESQSVNHYDLFCRNIFWDQLGPSSFSGFLPWIWMGGGREGGRRGRNTSIASMFSGQEKGEEGGGRREEGGGNVLVV